MIVKTPLSLAILVSACILLSSSALGAKVFSGGGGPFAFSQIPVSPREVAMGSMGTSFASGPSAMYWNPAGIAQEDSIQMTPDKSYKHYKSFAVSFSSRWNRPAQWKQDNDPYNMNASTNQNMDFLYIAMIPKITNIDFGFSWYSRGVEHIQETVLVDHTNEIETIGELSSRDNLFCLAVANKLPGGFALGLEYKYGQLTLNNGRKSNPQHGLDLGFQGSVDPLKLGLTLQSGFENEGDDDIYQYGLRAGICGKYHNLLVGLEGTASNYSPLKGSLGGELTLNNLLSFRLGFGFGCTSDGMGSGIDSFSTGFGFNLLKTNPAISIDTSYTQYVSIPFTKHSHHDNESIDLVDTPLKTSLSLKF